MLKEKSGPLKPHLSGFYFDREFIETLTEEQIKELQEENESTKRRRQRIIKDAEKEKDLKQMMLSTRQALQEQKPKASSHPPIDNYESADPKIDDSRDLHIESQNYQNHREG